jgi:hypothetical protein
VAPGEEILVEITWRVTDWTSPDLHKVLDCVYVNDRYAPELSGGERPTPNDGYFAYHYFVPADAPAGTVVCDQGFLSGPNGQEEYGRQVSDFVCFTVEHPHQPPAPPAAEVTTTTTVQPPETEFERIGEQSPPEAQTPVAAPAVPPAPATAVRPRTTELPRTGGDGGPARLAAAALGVAVLARRRSTRRARPPRP